MSINKKEVIAQYEFFKSTATKYIDMGEIAISAKYIELAARIGYKYNFRYSDDELEHCVHRISSQIYNVNTTFETNSNRVVFYDSFAMDNRGLTQQYLRAIFNWKKELLFITTQNHIGSDIIEELNAYQNIIIIQVDQSGTLKDNILKTIETIEKFKPRYSFLHFSPWDILGFSLWNIVNNVERYLINLTDHAFWLGKNCADYFLEFRKYGCHISHSERNIQVEKLLLQPYYPIQARNKFQGFPIEKGNRQIAFAGSTPYKIYGRNKLFLNIIKRILNENDNLVFLFAGAGNLRPIKEFIRSNNLENRFFLIGNRKDIDQVIKNIDIYINTFPMIGGLMSQLAAVNNKPIIGYTDLDLYTFNDVEDFLQTKTKGLLVKSDADEFVRYFAQLLNDETEKNKNIQATKDCVLTPSQFNDRLYKNIMTHEHIKTSFFKSIDLNADSISNLYIDMENNFIKEHYLIVLRTLKFQLLLDNSILGLKSVFRTLTNKTKAFKHSLSKI